MEVGRVPGILSDVEIKPHEPYRETFKQNRPFGLSTACTMYPTEEEFHDPHKYIQSIEDKGEQYGVVKVVPPASWRPKFRLDTGKYIFQTRKQQLSSIGGVTRATNSWLDRLEMFHWINNRDHVERQPKLNGNTYNYYQLKCAVDLLGGFDKVSDTNAWPVVCEKLGIPKEESDLTTPFHLFRVYERKIRPYEEYVEKVMKSQLFPDLEAFRRGILPAVNGNGTRKESRINTRASTQDEEPRRSSKRRKTNRGRMASLKTDRYDDDHESEDGNGNEDDDDYDKCAVCGDSGKSFELHCAHKDCERVFHVHCLRELPLSPTSKEVPAKWYCPVCIVGTGDYFLEEGDEYTLDQFKDFADEWRENYLEDHNIDLEGLSRDEIETIMELDFWTQVGDMNGTLTVEYGADIHSDTKTSAFPNVLDHARDPYAKDMWNLNNLPKHRASLFSLIKDISGVTTPWSYTGSLFSCFCWHSEDHYSYSVNYQHVGSTKTWYGIPGSYAEKFEKATRSLIPELFAKQPDILYQRSTMISPSALKDAGVPVYALDQHPGEFVITFPKAYHCGFNHGFNFNEAVNYAPPEWAPYGEECMTTYRIQKREPLFSHDQLLYLVAKRDTLSETARWLYPHLVRMVYQEERDRKAVARLYPGIRLDLIQTESKDKRFYQCCECNTIAYLSRVVVTDENEDRVYCLNHFPHPHEGSKTEQYDIKMELREKSKDLKDLCKRVKARITNDNAGNNNTNNNDDDDDAAEES